MWNQGVWIWGLQSQELYIIAPAHNSTLQSNQIKPITSCTISTSQSISAPNHSQVPCCLLARDAHVGGPPPTWKGVDGSCVEVNSYYLAYALLLRAECQLVS